MQTPRQRRITSFLALVTGLVLASGALAEGRLTPHKAEYQVKISVLSGRLNTELVTTEDGYKATHLIKPTGLAGALVGGNIFAESEFKEAPNGLVPLRYVANDEISSEKLRVDIKFDWDEQRAHGTYQTKDDPEAVELNDPLNGDVHDGVSIQYELMADLINGTSDPQYVLFEHDKVRKLEITNVGEQSVTTKAGTFTAVGVRHQAEGSSRATTLWLAKELGYLPVVIERHRKGKLQMRAKLVRYEPS